MIVQGIEFSDSELAQLQFGYHDLHKNPLLSHYSEFKGFTGFKTEAVLGYISLVYDPNTPLLKIQDPAHRKKIAAEIAGLKGADLSVIFDLRHEQFNHALTRWFEIQHNTRFELFISLSEAFSQLLSVIRKPVDDEMDDDRRMKAFKTKGDLQAMAIERERELAALSAEIFKAEPTAEQKVVRMAKKIRKGGFAESMVDKINGNTDR